MSLNFNQKQKAQSFAIFISRQEDGFLIEFEYGQRKNTEKI